jgi:hypothetical protein
MDRFIALGRGLPERWSSETISRANCCGYLVGGERAALIIVKEHQEISVRLCGSRTLQRQITPDRGTSAGNGLDLELAAFRC